MAKLLLHDPQGLDHLRTNIGAFVHSLHGCDLSDGSFIAVVEPAPHFYENAATFAGITVFPPAWKTTPLSKEHAAALSYAGVSAGTAMYEALESVHAFHGFPPFRPESF